MFRAVKKDPKPESENGSLKTSEVPAEKVLKIRRLVSEGIFSEFC